MFQPFQILERVASEHPQKDGLVAQGRRLTFAEMLATSRGLAQYFRDRGVRPRDVVVTNLPPATDWLVTLALFHEACITASLWGVGAVSSLDASWLIAAEPHPAFPLERTIIVSDTTLSDALTASPSGGRKHYARGDSSVRYVLTSGTSGAPKAVNFTVDLIDNRMRQMASYWTDSRPELNFMGLTTTGGFFTALSSLSHGTPYLAPESVNERVLALAGEHNIRVLAGSPTQVGHAVSVLKNHGIMLPALEEVRLAGSQPTAALVAVIAEHLRVPLKSIYGSTEGGGIAMRLLAPGDDRSNLGMPITGVTIEILNDEHNVLGPNVDGAVRYRTPGLSPGYVGVPLGASPFQGGWFSPGDYGHLTQTGELVLVGREDDLINVGGAKVSPGLIEDVAREARGVQDAATFIIERVPGVEEIGLALVADDSADLRGLDQALRRAFPACFPTVFGKVDALPMNRMGKVLRHQLSEDFSRRLSGS
jgi:long-chain acyl-CoA synthetase